MPITWLVTLSKREASFYTVCFHFFNQVFNPLWKCNISFLCLGLDCIIQTKRIRFKSFSKICFFFTFPIIVGFTFYKPAVFKHNMTLSSALLFSPLMFPVTNILYGCVTYDKNKTSFYLSSSNFSIYLKQYYGIYFIYISWLSVNLSCFRVIYVDLLNLVLKRMSQPPLHKRWTFSLRVSSENVTKSVVSYGFGQIYRINL